LSAAIGERDAIQIILNHRLALFARLFGSGFAGLGIAQHDGISAKSWRAYVQCDLIATEILKA